MVIMHRIETIRDVSQLIEDKIVQMTFEPDSETFIKWFRVMVGNATIEDDIVVYETLDGRRGGFDFRSDPSTKAVMIAFAIAGMQWTSFFPGLMGKVNKEWKKRKK